MNEFFRNRELRSNSWVKMMSEFEKIDPASRTDLLRTSIQES